MNLKEKEKVYNEYFGRDNIILKSLDGLPRFNSLVDDYVIKNRKLIFEMLELRGAELIRFAVGRDNDCTCRSFVCDIEDMLNLRNMLLERYSVEEYPVV